MAYTIQIGSRALDAETIQSVVEQTAQREYVMKTALATVSTQSLTHTFFRKDPAILTGQPGNAIEGVPFGANFPTGKFKLEKVPVRILKFPYEQQIPMEVERGSEVDLVALIAMTNTEAVVNAVDSYIVGELMQDLDTVDSSVEVQSYAITFGKYWDVSSAAITDDLAAAAQLISTNANVSSQDCEVHVTPRDIRAMKKWVQDKGSQWVPFASDMVQNGKLGKLGGFTIVENRSIPSSHALMIKPKTAATWFEFLPMQSAVIDDPLKGRIFRVATEGVVGRTNPKEIVVIKGTLSSPTA